MSDSALLARGYDSGGPAPLLILACGALGREIAALIRANGWTHARLHCLPAILHNHPDRIVPAAAAALDAIPHERAILAYADCGTGGALARLCAERGIDMLPGAHCYAFYEGVEAFGAGDMRAFYVTDFLVRQFDAFVARPLGLDRHPHLADDYFAGYERLIYQAQTDDPVLTAQARRIAARFGWAFERRLTGYGALATLG
ncbi:DUF1638 domain-containing protein [Hasllibacter halocynthiae]|uniref:DUF1638 domain-containing protein n=1 Tax=Hasllibacter halocynthiae TaxID=595589 RepID=UPI000D07C13F|nr:DUF1638 domain-containing protein [Hasllibacter halocynthiae]